MQITRVYLLNRNYLLALIPFKHTYIRIPPATRTIVFRRTYSLTFRRNNNCIQITDAYNRGDWCARRVRSRISRIPGE